MKKDDLQEDRELVEKAINGDTNAFEKLLVKYEKMVFNVAYRILRNREDAADATQEAFIKAYKSLGSFRRDAKFSTWVCTIVSNTCYDFLRKHKKHKTTPLYYSNDEEETEIALPDNSEIVDPLKMATASELRYFLIKAIEELEEDQKEVIILRELKDYSYQEISEELDVSIGTVKSRLNRARLKVVEKLRKESELLPSDLRQKN